MMGILFENDDCDDCLPHYGTHLQRRLDSVPASTIILSSLPFVVTWIVAVVFAQRRLFPALSRNGSGSSGKNGGAAGALPVWNTVDPFAKAAMRPQRLASLVFSSSIGLSTVLVELLLCEIANMLNPAARGFALRVVLGSLLVLSILVTPALEIHGFARAVIGGDATSSEGTSTKRSRSATAKSRMRYVLEVGLMGTWLAVFWYIPQTSILRRTLHSSSAGGHDESEHVFTEACLERIGIIGISLMASLSGFAAVSSLWQTFGVRHRTIRDTDLARKEAGLAATEEMLAAKQSRLRALQRKMSESASSPASDQPAGFVARMMGSLRSGGADVQEHRSLEMEISGLQTMAYTLSTSLSGLHVRYAEQTRSRSRTGRLLNLFNTIFALYCAYRICATSISSLRRWWQPSHSFATSDPINNILAILTTHWDKNLDQAAWSRQISFLLSGVMLLASFNAVLQTFRLFARFTPSLLHPQHHVSQTSLPLIISQIAGTYVISSALLLRSNLPEEVRGVISEALGAPLEGRFVEGWFESWFLASVIFTSMGIFVGRKFGSNSAAGGAGDWDDWDDYEGMEMAGGKRS